MKKRLRQCLKNAAPAVAAFFVLAAWSYFQARKTCSALVREELGPPYHSTRFVLYPDRYIDGANRTFKPGWVVTCAYPEGIHGSAFHVNVVGKVISRGTPVLVIANQRNDEMVLNRFRMQFAQLDAAITEGSSFSNALAILGQPITTLTNDDGSWQVFFHYGPPPVSRIDWLTNGFTLVVSNHVIVREAYSYTSTH